MSVHCHRERAAGVRWCPLIYGLQCAVQRLRVHTAFPRGGTVFPRLFGNDFEIGPQWLPQVSAGYNETVRMRSKRVDD
jgi:hypothetical protein